MTFDHFPLFLAQSGLTFLIYLVVGAFWLIGNLSQQKKAKARAEEMRRRREEREREEARTGKKPSKPHPLEQDLEAFLGRLAGETQAPAPKTAPPPLQPKRVEYEIQFDQAPPPSFTKTVPPPIPASSPAASAPMDLDTSFADIEDIKDAVEISYDQMEGVLREQNLNAIGQMQVDLSAMMVDIPRLPVPRMHSGSGTTAPPALRDKKAFKKAILSGVLLGPPVALQDPQADGR